MSEIEFTEHREVEFTENYWNYRILENVDPIWGSSFSIIEVYYDNGRITGWSHAEPYGDDPIDLQADLHRMLEAFQRPLLKKEDLEENG